MHATSSERVVSFLKRRERGSLFSLQLLAPTFHPYIHLLLIENMPHPQPIRLSAPLTSPLDKTMFVLAAATGERRTEINLK